MNILKSLGISPFLKNIISLEKFYLYRPQSCFVKLSKICEDNYLPCQLPNLIQLQNYIYRYKEQLIAENYPEVKQYLTEVVKKTFNSSLNQDELFFIHSQFEKGEVSVLFSSKALIENLIKQSQQQPSFLHIDATYKLIDLGLPLFVISTENINHAFRPICFFISWSESTNQVVLMLTKLKVFMKENFDFELKPEYILTDNSDALISGCKKSFSNKFTHLGCHFHLGKRLREKTQSKELKEKKQLIFFGVKMLKNSPNHEFFRKVWEIIQDYWKENGVCSDFITTFEKEYIKKQVQWHFGAAFSGKSRSNNSLESGNNVLKLFFNRKAQNIKTFLAKMKEFIIEWSAQNKISFPNQVTYKSEIMRAAEERTKEENFVFSEETPDKLYYPRKGVSKELLNTALIALLNRKDIPDTLNELHKGWSYYRIIDVLQNECNCADFYRYNYCKHLLSLQMLDGQLGDPEIKAKGKRGRKPTISKALKM